MSDLENKLIVHVLGETDYTSFPFERKALRRRFGPAGEDRFHAP